MTACGVFQVMRGEQPEEVALSTAESDHDHVSQVSAMTAGSQSVQDMDAPTASGNPWSSSPMRSEVGFMTSSWQHFFMSDSWNETVAMHGG